MSASKKILVVEDEVNQGLLYEQELSDEGYEVHVANSGDDALALVADHSYDLVVLDIGMPGMDGLETLGRMLSLNNKIPVILNTAYPSYKDNFMSWAADAYVVKSSDLSELKQKIRESIEKRSTR
jgi:DNA-binding response OmpR family regulator